MMHPETAKIVIFLLMIITNITLLNFAIAILSNTYSLISANSSPIYLTHIMNLRSMAGSHKFYSHFICAISGLNVLFIPFIPLQYII